MTYRKKLRSIGNDISLKPCDPEKCCLTTAVERYLWGYLGSFEKLATDLRDMPCADFPSFVYPVRYRAANFIHPFDPRKIVSSICSSSGVGILRFLSCDENAIVSRPDTGCGVVICDGSQYVSSVNNISSDNSMFSCVAEPLRKISFRFEDKINRCAAKLKSVGFFNESI